LAPFKDMPKLEELYLANNIVANITGYEAMPKLRLLHLRKNRIEKIDDEMPPLDSLEYLNLRGNKIPNLEQLEKLY
jgi:Leucine-rich repeat (LRR) protein